MADKEDWFTRQASRTAEDIKQLPERLRTQRNEERQEEQKKREAVPCENDRKLTV
jgi:hypothetical protein